MGSKPDYYELLGISRSATDKEIKSAYRRLARKYHPDLNKGDKAAEDNFKAVAEAFAVLSDKEKRARYDSGGHEAFGRGFDPFAGFNPQDLNVEFGNFADILNMFGGGFAGGRRRGPRRPQRGDDLQLELPVSFLDAVRGTTVEILIPRRGGCGDCSGSGLAPGARQAVCPDCQGSGRVEQGRGGIRLALACPRCSGSGRQPGDPCPACRGSGTQAIQDRMKVRIPAGIDDGGRVRIAGKGDAGSSGAPPGDAYLTIRVEPDEQFSRQGRDLSVDVPIDLATAGLGGTVAVPTPDGSTTITIPKATKSSQKFRLKGRGIPAGNGKPAGDLFAVVQIHPPKKLTKRTRELLEELRELNPAT